MVKLVLTVSLHLDHPRGLIPGNLLDKLSLWIDPTTTTSKSVLKDGSSTGIRELLLSELPFPRRHCSRLSGDEMFAISEGRSRSRGTHKACTDWLHNRATGGAVEAIVRMRMAGKKQAKATLTSTSILNHAHFHTKAAKPQGQYQYSSELPYHPTLCLSASSFRFSPDYKLQIK